MRTEKIEIKLPESTETLLVEFTDDGDDIIIKEVYFNGCKVYNLILALNNIKGFNVVDYIYDIISRRVTHLRIQKRRNAV